MRTAAGLIFFFMTITLISSEFDLFEERESIDESVFRDHKFNKVISSYSIYPSDRKKFALSYSHFFNNKIGFVFETALSESGDSYAEKSDFMLGLTYRFTRRARTWIFSGDLGLSANDDVKDYEGISKGFRLNHLTGKFISEYIFPGGFGLAYTMTGRMPLEFDLDEDVSPIHAVALTFQF